jgi:hypothetical protein
MSERIVLDPAEFIEGRAELSLAELGLEVREQGVDFGESQLEIQLARQQIGESASNRHLTNVEMTIPIRVQKEGSVSLAEAAYKLQQKVGMWQAEGGWLRRDFDAEGKFAGSVGYEIVGANLAGLQGWLMAHRQSAPDVTLKLVRKPLCYATEEIEGAEVKASKARDLQWEIADVLGAAPGLIRLRVKNENSTEDWRGLISSIESRDYSEEATAELAYECEALTPLGGAVIVEKAEASGGKVVEHSSLTAGWLTILGSEIAGVGQMTHRGVRRMKMRVFDPSASVGTVQLRLEWRALGSTSWSQNSIVEAPLVGSYAIIDLGECRPETAILGNQQWEWRIIARAPGGLGAIRLDRVWPLAVEQMVIANAPAGEVNTGNAVSTKSPGTVVDDASLGTKGWEKAEEAKISDNKWATATGGGNTHYLKATSFGFEVPPAATITAILIGVERSMTGEGFVGDEAIRVVKGGEILPLNRAKPGEAWPEIDQFSYYGGDLWGQSWTPADINASTFGAAIAAETLNVKSITARVDSIKISVYYSEGQDENRVCFAGRSAELRSDGIYRQQSTAEVWGRLIPEGFLPYGAPGGLEKRKMRGIMIPSQGDLGLIADSGVNKLSIKPIYRPAYLYAREAI